MGGIIPELPPLPESADEPTFTIPLASLMRDPGSTVDRVIGTLYKQELAEIDLFTTLQQRLYENICLASGIPPQLSPSRSTPGWFYPTPASGAWPALAAAHRGAPAAASLARRTCAGAAAQRWPRA